MFSRQSIDPEICSEVPSLLPTHPNVYSFHPVFRLVLPFCVVLSRHTLFRDSILFVVPYGSLTVPPDTKASCSTLHFFSSFTLTALRTPYDFSVYFRYPSILFLFPKFVNFLFHTERKIWLRTKFPTDYTSRVTFAFTPPGTGVPSVQDNFHDYVSQKRNFHKLIKILYSKQKDKR